MIFVSFQADPETRIHPVLSRSSLRPMMTVIVFFSKVGYTRRVSYPKRCSDPRSGSPGHHPWVIKKEKLEKYIYTYIYDIFVYIYSYIKFETRAGWFPVNSQFSYLKVPSSDYNNRDKIVKDLYTKIKLPPTPQPSPKKNVRPITARAEAYLIHRSCPDRQVLLKISATNAFCNSNSPITIDDVATNLGGWNVRNPMLNLSR